LLDSAGVSNLEFDYVVTSSVETNGFGQIVQADYQKLGVKINLRSRESATWVDQVNNRKFNGVYFSTARYFNLSPSTAFTNGKGFNPHLNNSAFTSEAYVQLINAAAAETDPAQQKAIYSQLNDLMLDESFVLFVYPAPASWLVASSSVWDETRGEHGRSTRAPSTSPGSSSRTAGAREPACRQRCP
jgi:ABC-type transport system substrate-binding protein